MRVPNVDSRMRWINQIVRVACSMRTPRVDPEPVISELEGMRLPISRKKLITVLDALISIQVDEAIVDGYDPYGLLEPRC